MHAHRTKTICADNWLNLYAIDLPGLKVEFFCLDTTGNQDKRYEQELNAAVVILREKLIRYVCVDLHLGLV